jgi:hypothetical protein
MTLEGVPSGVNGPLKVFQIFYLIFDGVLPRVYQGVVKAACEYVSLSLLNSIPSIMCRRDFFMYISRCSLGSM